MFSLCPPTIIYIIFSITHVIIDSFNGLYNTALMKMIVMIMISLLLNILCEKGLAIIAWFIVFIPFIMMTLIISMLLYVFGLNATTGMLNTSSSLTNNTLCKADAAGNIMIYDPYYNAQNNPVYYNNPYVIIPKPIIIPSSASNKGLSNIPPTYNAWSSSNPAFKF